MPACNIEEGSCFGTVNVSNVNAGAPGAIQAAVDLVPDGTEHAIVLTGDGPTGHTVTIDGGKTIAIVSSNATVREIRGAGGNPTLRVTGSGTTAYLHRVNVLANTDDWGVRVLAQGTLYADNTQVAQNSGGGVDLQAGTEAFLRNCMVGGEIDVDALSVTNASAEILYTTLFASLGDTAALACTNPGSVEVRNSIVTTRGANPALACTGASVSNTATENTANTAWFANYNNGDAHLTAAGGIQFNEVATWETGDPPSDFDGDARPTMDDTMDYAGADIP
jgi:hypothetical protein